MNDLDQIVDRLRLILIDDLAWPLDPERDVTGEAVGAEGIGLDSLTVIDFCMCIEQRFDIPLSDNEVRAVARSTVAEVANIISTRRGA